MPKPKCVFNSAYCNMLNILFLEHKYSSGVVAPSIGSCAPKISAVRLKIYNVVAQVHAPKTKNKL